MDGRVYQIFQKSEMDQGNEMDDVTYKKPNGSIS